MKKWVKKYIIWTIVTALVLSLTLLISFWQESSKAASIKTMSWVVVGRTYIIDPGHGGEDPGKVGVSGVLEKDINLEVAKKLRTVLIQGGGKVIMTREKDEALSQGEDTIRARKRADLLNRVAMAENERADIYIALHCNAFPSPRWYGAQTFYSPFMPGSKELASYIQDEITSYLKNTTRKPKPDNTTLIFKKAKMPIVNVEMGFLSNPKEEKMLCEPEYQDKLAWSIYSGIVKYLVENGDAYSPTVNRINQPVK